MAFALENLKLSEAELFACSHRRSLSPAQAKTEDGELPAPVNGTKEKASERSKSLERRTSPLKDHRRSPHGSSRHDLKDRGRSRSKERRRSLSRERGRPKEDRRSKTAEKEDGASAVNGTSHPKAEAAEDAAKKAEVSFIAYPCPRTYFSIIARVLEVQFLCYVTIWICRSEWVENVFGSLLALLSSSRCSMSSCGPAGSI